MFTDRFGFILTIINQVHLVEQAQVLYLGSHVQQLTEGNPLPHYSQVYVRAFMISSFGSRTKKQDLSYIGETSEHITNTTKYILT